VKISQPISQTAVRGVALITTLIFLAVALVVFASIFSWVNSNATVTARNNQYQMSENAAESAVKWLWARWTGILKAAAFPTWPACTRPCL